MAKIKVVVVTDDIDYRVRMKNMVECDEIEMSGYADYDNGTVLKIRGLFSVLLKMKNCVLKLFRKFILKSKAACLL